MQERRRTIRVPCRIDAACHRVEETPPASARLTNLSLRGAALVSSQGLDADAQVTLRFSLPHDDTPLSIGGRIRWTDGASGFPPRYAAGVEFGALDETTRFCLNAFLEEQAHHLKSVAPPSSPWREPLQRIASLPLAKHVRGLVMALVIAGLSLAILGLQRYNRRLRQTLEDHARVIQQLETHHELLVTELHTTQQQTALLGQQLNDLQLYTSQLESHADALADQLAQTRQEYVRLLDDRETLRQQFTQLEQQQQTLEARFHSLPDLRQAMAEAIALQRRRVWLARREQLRLLDQQELASGNRGYLLQRSASPDPTLSIRVHAPQEAATTALSGGP